jgi:hypothetical protein
MTTRRILAVTAGVALAAGFAPAPAGAATKATAKVVLTGACFDGEMIEGKDDDNCQIMVTVTPKNRNVSAVLEVAYDEEDPTWEEYDAGKTRGGRLIFEIASTNQDEVWMDGVMLYRVRVRKSGGVTVPKVRTYKVEYVSAAFADDGDSSLTDEEKAQLDAMEAAMADNEKNIRRQQPNTDQPGKTDWPDEVRQGGRVQPGVRHHRRCEERVRPARGGKDTEGGAHHPRGQGRGMVQRPRGEGRGHRCVLERAPERLPAVLTFSCSLFPFDHQSTRDRGMTISPAK